MHRRLTIVIWLCMLLAHGLLVSFAVYSDVFRGSMFEAVGITLFVIPYLLHAIGLPTTVSASSGWGWPEPNFLGWIFSIAFWLGLYFLIAKLIVYLFKRFHDQKPQ